MGKRRGKQNPTQEVKLPFKKSHYKEAIAYYEKSGRTAQKWQENLLKSLLAYRPKDGLWVHTKFGYSIPRRNGKNEVVVMRELYALYTGESVLHTAHRTSTSHSAWERLKRIIESSGLESGVDYVTLRASGRERIEFLATKGRVEFRTRTNTGGLGEGYDLLVIDEAQEYTDAQETALKYVVSDSKNPQTIFCGTPPTMVSAGTVFEGFRKKALEGNTKNAAWAEWSVDDEADPNDRELWYATNPSLGTILTERAIEDEIGSDVLDFNIQRLGLWVKYNQKSAISTTDWGALQLEKLPSLQGKLFVGIKYGRDGTNVALSVAVKTTTGQIFTEVVDCQPVRNGSAWILYFLKNADVQGVVIDGASRQNILAQEMQENRLMKPVLPTVKEIVSANALFEQAVHQKTLAHMGQLSLHQVATNCEKRAIGTNGGFGYKSQFEEYDIALMDSVILAHWACSTAKEAKKQRVFM